MADYDDDQDDAVSADRGRRALSKSTKVNTRAGADSKYLFGEGSLSAERDDHEGIRLQMHNIEHRLQQANAKRETFLKNQLDGQANYVDKLSTIKSVKDQIIKDKEWDTMNRVVLKHHDKDAQLVKQAKEQKALRAYAQASKNEGAVALKSKIHEIARERQERASGYQERYEQGLQRMDQVKLQEREYTSIRKENNMFKVLDQQENARRLKRGQSAYKRHLIERLIEKGDRGKEIQSRRNRLSEMAM